MNESQCVTERLAAQILQYPTEALSAAVAHKAIDCVLDSVASCLAGVSARPAISARQAAYSVFANGDAPIWFTQRRLSVAGASWCNAMAASSLDFDDGHRLARGHPGSAIVPAVLAQASRVRSSTSQILAAIAIGYEVVIRSAAAQRFEKAQTYQSGRWAGLGVVAACGRLVGLDSDQLSNALAIAGVWAPNLQANGSSGYARQTGNWAKEGIPISTVQALMAIDLSRDRFTGPKDLLDHTSHYAYCPPIGDALEPTLILETYFKRYACCRYVHPALDAYCSLVEDVAVEVDSIARIEVATFAQALRLANKLTPNNLVEVQYSLPFCSAALVLRGPAALSPITEDLLHDDRVPALATRINLNVCPTIDQRFPRETLAKVRITFKTGDVSENLSPIGPTVLSRQDVRCKFLDLAKGRISEVQCQRLLDAVDPDHCDLGKLQRVLAQTSSID
ncbi:MmgE/PrpD family protein (plasmid) [Devosia sp. A8/3-2]|nr:MmgE/PrpD family protein [Devosia sp. A8/3-2]